MLHFTLKLSMEEVKTLQLILEREVSHLCQHGLAEIESDLLTKVTLIQLEPLMSKREAAYVRDANYPAPREDGPAF